MARIRTIKPEFWSDEKLAPLEPIARLVFLGLISQADDAGRLVDSVRQLDGLLFPFSEDSCAESLETLARLSRIRRYTSASGQRLIQITNWEEHQRVDKPSKYVLPEPPPQDQESQQDTESSRDTRDTLARPSRPDHGPTTYDHGPTTVERGARDSVFGSMGEITVISLKGLYGWPPDDISGTDEGVWPDGLKWEDRKRCMQIAVQRLEGEDRKYNGRLFRRILETVISEQTDGGDGPTRRTSGPLFPEAEAGAA